MGMKETIQSDLKEALKSGQQRQSGSFEVINLRYKKCRDQK